MANPSKESDSVAAKALEAVARRAGIQDPIIVHRSGERSASTGEPLQYFRVASGKDPNGPQQAIALTNAGVEVALADLHRESVATTPAATPLLPAAAPVATIDPKDNKFELNPGDNFSETITVTIPGSAGVAKADVYFLADTTGSMGSYLNAVISGAGTIFSQLNALGLDLAYGVGNYKDFPNDPYAFQHQLNPSPAGPAVAAALNAWSAGGGSDTPEGNLFALHRLCQPGIGWRAGAKRIVVWFGDAPGHDPVCPAISGEANPVTEASVKAELTAANITVLAISTATPGLDDDPKSGAGDYTAKCGAPGGTAGQATRLAAATGGQFVTSINPANLVTTIVGLVKGAVSSINNVSLVPTGAIVPFVASISPAGGYGPLAGNEPHTLKFEVKFVGKIPCKDTAQVFNGTLDVVADGRVIARKPVEITVPPCKDAVFYSYGVKFVCGAEPDCACSCAPVRPGSYATEITIYNHNPKEAAVRKYVVPVVLAGAPAGREPRAVGPRAEDKIVLQPHYATMDDCCRLAELLLGAPAQEPLGLTTGILEIVSTVELTVTAVYTATGPNGKTTSIDVESIMPKIVRLKAGT